jgi:threonine/homoserine/homoserine lactone efflux protein
MPEPVSPASDSSDVANTDGSTSKKPSVPDLISDTSRNGMITAIGIFLGFALGFIAPWSLNPSWSIDPQHEAWKWWDIITLLLVFGGIGVITCTLYRVLVPYEQPQERWQGHVLSFIIGILFVFGGLLWAIVVSILKHP